MSASAIRCVPLQALMDQILTLSPRFSAPAQHQTIDLVLAHPSSSCCRSQNGYQVVTNDEGLAARVMAFDREVCVSF